MHKDRIPEDCSDSEQEQLDRELAKWQVRVLSLVLSEHPILFHQDEIAHELLSESLGFEQRDGLRQAISSLRGIGLLHQIQGLVIPTRAALCFYRLELE